MRAAAAPLPPTHSHLLPPHSSPPHSHSASHHCYGFHCSCVHRSHSSPPSSYHVDHPAHPWHPPPSPSPPPHRSHSHWEGESPPIREKLEEYRPLLPTHSAATEGRSSGNAARNANDLIYVSTGTSSIENGMSGYWPGTETLPQL